MRTVKVGLEATVAGYNGPIDSAKAKTEELDRKIEALDRDLKKVPADALKAAAAVKALGDGAKVTGEDIKTIGDKSAALSVLDSRISKTRGEVKQLTEEFMRTGDVDVFQKLGSKGSELRGLNEARKKLADAIEGGSNDGTKRAGNVFTRFFGDLATMAGKAGEFVGTAVSDGVGEAFKSVPPEMKAGIIAALGVAALAAIPVIVTAVDTALLLGIGAGGLAAGIGIAAQDANVQKVYSDLGQHIMTSLGKAATPFRSELVGAAMMFQDSWDKVIPSINRDFATLAKGIRPLASGLTGLFENAAPGLEKAFQGALPLIEDLGNWLPKLGSEVGDLGEALARAEPEAEMLFKFLLANVDVAVKTVTFLTNGVHALVGAMMQWVGAYQPISPALAEDKGSMDELSEAATKAADDVKSISEAFTQVGQSAETAFTSSILNNMFALTDATLGFQESLNKLDDGVKKNGRSLDIHTDKGLANARALESAAKANATLYEQNVRSGMSAEEAGRQYDANSGQLKKAAAAAGYNAGQVQALIGKYDNVPDKVSTLIAVDGLSSALNRLGDILIKMNHLDGREFSSTYTLVYRHTGSVGGKEDPSKYAQGGIRRAASGMVVAPSDPGSVLFGEPETGGEALIPLRGIPQARAMTLAQTVGDAHGFDVVQRGGHAPRPVSVSVELKATGTGRGLWAAMHEAVRTGDLQLVAKVA